MISMPINDEMIENARLKSEDMGHLRNSITTGEGNIAGFIGEFVANIYVVGDLENTFDYDIIKNGVKYDVKTKRCTSPPKPHFECSVAAFNTTQDCDRYVFVRVDLERRMAYLLGWLDKDEYYRKARKLTKGQIDPSNNFVVKADCYNLPISELKQFEVSNANSNSTQR